MIGSPVLKKKVSNVPAAGGRLDVFYQMALDEAVLTLAPEGSLVLRFYRWVEPSVTFGYSQSFEVARRAVHARGMDSSPIARRASGGGVVFHDGDVTFSLVFPWRRLSPPGKIYQKIHRGVHLGLKAAGIATRLWSPARSGGDAPALECFTGLAPMDLVSEAGLKVLGGAMRRRAGRGLYQGSLRPELLGGHPIGLIKAAIAEGLSREWGREPIMDLDPLWTRVGARLTAKYSSTRWNHRR